MERHSNLMRQSGKRRQRSPKSGDVVPKCGGVTFVASHRNDFELLLSDNGMPELEINEGLSDSKKQLR